MITDMSGTAYYAYINLSPVIFSMSENYLSKWL